MSNGEPEELGERTYRFARDARDFVKDLQRTIGNVEDARQLVRSSGSVAANWIEADEALSRKDRLFRMKLCRKESKESRLWLRLLQPDGRSTGERERLLGEAQELTLIFAAIVRKLE